MELSAEQQEAMHHFLAYIAIQAGIDPASATFAGIVESVESYTEGTIQRTIDDIGGKLLDILELEIVRI